MDMDSRLHAAMGFQVRASDLRLVRTGSVAPTPEGDPTVPRNVALQADVMLTQATWGRMHLHQRGD